MEILWAFRYENNKEAVELIVKSLKDDSKSVRVTAAEFLGYIKDPETVKHLKLAIDNEKNKEVLSVAIAALKKTE